MSPSTQRVVFVESYPHVIAGQQRTMLSLLETAPTRGIRPVLMVPGEGVYVDRVRETGIETVVVPYPDRMSRYGGAIYHDGMADKLHTLADVWGYAWHCRVKLKELQPAAVFCNDMRGLLTVGVATRSLRIPVMIWDKLDKPHGVLDWFQLPISSRNAIISESVTNKYPRWQRWWYRNRIDLVPNGADIAKIDRGQSIRSELGISAEEIVVAIIGTVTRRKGHDRLLGLVPDLVRRVPDIRILVVGSWEDSQQDQEFFQSLENKEHPRVQFLGQRSDIEDILQSIDILAIPSRHEGMGQVTVEAMAAGKPVVGADVGGIPEVVVDGESGLIFPQDDRQGFLDCLIRLAESKEEREVMGQAGRIRCQRYFNRPIQIAKVCEQLRSLIKS